MRIKALLFRLPSLFPILYLALFHREGVLSLKKMQAQMADLFQKDRTVISRHIRNVFKEGELDESLVCAKFALPKKYGRRAGYMQEREATIYNLDYAHYLL